MNKQQNEGETTSKKAEIATLGGGCFWCIEAVFAELEGVQKVESGYAGGVTDNPDYEQVCSGNTGHAEVVQVTFDPDEILFKEILEVFFTAHDPTTLNRQGADMGTQYRSVIFYHDEKQKTEAEEVIRELNESGIWDNPIVTELSPFTRFFKAENYHQEYFKYNGQQPYCRLVVAPKVAKVRKRFADWLKKS